MNECMFASAMYDKLCIFACSTSMNFIQFLGMFMFMGLLARMFNFMVVSSSPIGGSGTLHCGIRAHVAAWASMGHEESVTEASYPLPNRGKMRK